MLGDALTHDAHGLHFVVAEVHFFAGHGGLEGDVHLAAGGSRRRWGRGGGALRSRYRRCEGCRGGLGGFG